MIDGDTTGNPFTTGGGQAMNDSCARCARTTPLTSRWRGWDYRWNAKTCETELLCPDCCPPEHPDSPEVKQLQQRAKLLRAERRDSDDPDQRALLREEIADLHEEIEELRERRR
jgi:recombinational DNA repair protein (RecF pathway)